MHQLIDLATQVGHELKSRNWMLATAESCTGGGIAQAVTEIAGSSSWFDRGFVTYSNESKIAMLNVTPQTLADHGAVSEQTAAAMAQGALANSTAHAALSTTGIAGPGGAVPGKPVGTVCFAWAIGNTVYTEQQFFSGDRHAVRQQSIAYALQGLLHRLSGGT